MPTWTESELQRVELALVGLAELWRHEFTAAQLSIYLRALQSLTAKEVCDAVDLAIVRCKYMPKPAELIELVQGNLDCQAGNAWRVLLDTIRSIGHPGSVFFEDARTSQLVTYFGGWETVCEWKEKELEYRRTEFMKRYVSISNPQPSIKHVGASERTLLADGWDDHVPPPHIISKDGKKNQVLMIPGKVKVDWPPQLEGGKEATEEDKNVFQKALEHLTCKLSQP